jgi:hypothetical protein
MSRTVAELKMEARELGVELPKNARKAQIIEALEAKGENVVSYDGTPSGPPESGTKSLDNSTIGSNITTKPEKEELVVADDKVALYSNRNLSWGGVGKLDKGYNFVPKAKAEKWLTQKSVRATTPKEVRDHYGV